jgi:hypothetical protein
VPACHQVPPPWGRSIGLLAQDVEQVAPELVVTDEEGFKNVDYTRLTVLLVQAVKSSRHWSAT